MTPDEFIRAYENALASQDWTLVEPLVHEDVHVTFSNGVVHRGKPAVQAAFETNFRTIEDEDYRITNVHWVLRQEDVAIYVFDFAWSGRIGGRAALGGGRGCSVLIREGARWKLLLEHLGPKPPVAT